MGPIPWKVATVLYLEVPPLFALRGSGCGCWRAQVTVWSSGVPRPLLVLKRAFEKTVVDLSWSSDGYTLYCASIDGTVAVATFTEGARKLPELARGGRGSSQHCPNSRGI